LWVAGGSHVANWAPGRKKRRLLLDAGGMVHAMAVQ
jgi:hypothetical protein